MKSAYVDKHGFTIVELLIVIVVIAILAAISMAAYSGIAQRAENNKLIVAMEGYLKAIKMYQAENGDIPRMGDGVCLGKDYLWDYAGNSSGMNQCMRASISYYLEGKSSALTTALSTYVNPLPQPSMVAVGSSSSSWYRGIVYYHTGPGGTYRLSMPLQGNVACRGGDRGLLNIEPIVVPISDEVRDLYEELIPDGCISAEVASRGWHLMLAPIIC